ncbi:hypothetical protein [Agrobacterium salinitolerans]|uniref:hypothetical protein n=1 Tax=Agrobacterium salinitolerans TaxID=1183413 RepID=UPI001FCE8B08|nr:hypothetical protein [Agrobacterium salinitolerans]
MLLGGMAAEEVILGDVFDGSGGVAGSDLQRASDIATIMLASLGLESLQYCNVSSSNELNCGVMILFCGGGSDGCLRSSYRGRRQSSVSGKEIPSGGSDAE